MVLLWLPAAALLWPRVRGVPWRTLRAELGWTIGRGVPREIGAGLVGYLAGLPIVALGLGLTLLLNRLTGEDASHPIARDAAGGSAFRVVLLLCVWAPLVEESVFRGALYRSLRPALRPVAAAAIVGVIFAALHPQGWTAIPVLASLGLSFALIREWRGTLIAPMAAHALHNGFVAAFFLAVR
jgi:membrane protease YdiL (CAAX protease family)